MIAATPLGKLSRFSRTGRRFWVQNLLNTASSAAIVDEARGSIPTFASHLPQLCLQMLDSQEPRETFKIEWSLRI
jgi:hypothetical protein